MRTYGNNGNTGVLCSLTDLCIHNTLRVKGNFCTIQKSRAKPDMKSCNQLALIFSLEITLVTINGISKEVR